MATRTDIAARLEMLSPERRALVERWLTEQKQRADATPIRRLHLRSAPLSFSQERLWFIEQLIPDTALHNVSVALSLTGPLNDDALARSVQEVVRRHDALRTRVAVSGGRPEQVVDGGPIAFERFDCGEGRGACSLAEVMQAFARTPLDLGRGPLVRAGLARLSPDEHVLLLTAHHLVVDGWALAIVTREVGALYGAFAAGEPSPLPEPALQFTDFAVWQREELESGALAGELEHVRRRLETAPRAVEFSGSMPRPRLKSYRGETFGFDFPAPLVDGLRAVSARNGVTLFMTLLAGFGALLGRYTQSGEAVVGAPVAARTRPELESVVGLFANTLAFRIDLRGDPSFEELLARTREVTLDALAHVRVPFGRLVTDLHVERDPSRTPIFQTMLLVDDAPALEADFGALTIRPLDLDRVGGAPLDSGGARVDLLLTVQEGAGGLRAAIEYSTDLFDREYVAGFAARLQRLFEHAVGAPQERLSSYSLLAEDERRRLVVDWNRTEREPATPACAHELVEAVARTRGDDVALLYEGRRLTYRELDRRANALAHRLRRLGARPETLVAVALDRGPDLVVALLAVLKSGAAYVPLDPSHPPKRTAVALEETCTPIVVTSERVRQALPATGAEVVLLDGAGAEGATDAPPDGGASPAGLAYVIFTSGSTGRPRGVMISHGALVNLLRAMAERPGLEATDVLLAVTTPAFDIAALELFLPLTAGATAAVAADEDVVDPVRLRAAVVRSGATTMQATPATWRLLDGAGVSGGVAPLKVLCGGEALPVELARRILEDAGSLWNLYGPTEATIWSTVERVRVEDLAASGTVPIGRPIANTEAYVLDPNLELTPVGLDGRLYLGGSGLARGYLRNAALTAERFVPDPFGKRPGGRLYDTGDLARRLPDGRLEFLGRSDDQVKLRGFRIELGEIESTLRRHPRVRDAAAVLDAAGSPTARIVAFVVPVDPGGGAPDVADLSGFLADRLPAYMVPERLVGVDRLPLSPSGKLDRAALLASVPPPQRPAYVQPQGELVRAVAAIWSEVLEVDAVGTADNFFDLGGHSLLLAQVQARIGERLGCSVPIVEFFEHPTVESLARHLRDAHPVDAPAAPAAGRDRGRLRRQAARPRARDNRGGRRP